jgi:hypothetical protein
MAEKRDKPIPEPAEEHRGEHNELHYYKADEEKSYDERGGSQTEGPGEDETPGDDRS